MPFGRADFGQDVGSPFPDTSRPQIVSGHYRQKRNLRIIMSTAPSYTKELENYGIPGPSALRDLLTSSNNLPETIKEFQAANSIQLPSLKPVMKLLDLHNIRRTEYHELVVHELTDKILLKLRALGEKRTPDSVRKLERQLEKCFKLYKVPKIRPIVLETLKQLPKVADRYLKLIICDKEFYDSCAVTVRQQIWVKNDGLFLEAINPVIASYITEKDKIFLSIEKLQTNFFTCDTTKSRRQWPQVQELISMVGEREVLYERLMEIIRERYFEAGNTHYCSLRLELLMAAHDVNVEHVVKVDPCHDFAWCLDACVRDKHLDSQQTNKLKILLDTGKKSSTKVLADMAMIASDPHVVHFLCSMSIKVLRDNASSGAYLPREQNALQLLIKLIALGASGKNIITEQIPQQLVDPIIFTKFLPSFTMSMIEDIFRYELNKAPDEVADEYQQEKSVSPPNPLLTTFLKADVVCSLLWIHYTLDLLPTKRRVHENSTILRYFQMLPRLKDKVAYRDPWVHLLVHRLVTSNQFSPLLSDETVSRAVISDFLLRGIEINPNIRFHLLKLCTHLKGVLGEAYTRSILEQVAPDPSKPDVGSPTLAERFVTEYERITQKITLDRTSSLETNSEVASVKSDDTMSQ